MHFSAAISHTGDPVTDDGEDTEDLQKTTAMLQKLLSGQLQPSPPQSLLPPPPLQVQGRAPFRPDSGYASRNLSRYHSAQSPP